MHQQLTGELNSSSLRHPLPEPITEDGDAEWWRGGLSVTRHVLKRDDLTHRALIGADHARTNGFDTPARKRPPQRELVLFLTDPVA